MPGPETERRSARRYAVVMGAMVTDLLTRTSFKLRCSDISLTGCYLDTLNPIEAGTPLTIRLEHGQHVFECQARVAYLIPRFGMGIVFMEPIPEEQLTVLNVWVSEAASLANPQPSLFGFSASH